MNILPQTTFTKRRAKGAWYFNKVLLQYTLRSDVSAILKSINVLEIVREFEVVKQ